MHKPLVNAHTLHIIIRYHARMIVYQPKANGRSHKYGRQTLTRPDWFTLGLLILATALSYSLIVGNWVYQSDLKTGLLWNLCLAWVPMLIAFFIRATKPNKLFLLPLLGLWLLFWPNAPYIFTDLIHLGWLDQKGLWLDLLTILSASFVGLFTGLASLSWVHAAINEKMGKLLGWLFVLGALGSGGVGIYIGRFLHWNSWDAITNPRTIISTLEPILTDKWGLLHMTIFSAVFALIFFFVYAMMFILPMAHRD